jgi:hypothetical protein
MVLSETSQAGSLEMTDRRINSRSKGKRGELEAAAEVRKYGYSSRRGQQFSGSGDSPDVIHSVPGIHLEVKRCEKFRIWVAIDQANEDCPVDKKPVVMHRKNNREWLAIQSFRNFMETQKELKELRNTVKGLEHARQKDA